MKVTSGYLNIFVVIVQSDNKYFFKKKVDYFIVWEIRQRVG